jgi:FMN phosphatase YigB (HAD superfamily)
MDYFDSVIIDVSKTSQHYIKCMREMGTTPETTAIVDDRTARGIKVGNQLGCKTFWIQRGEYSHEMPNQETGEPTYRIDSIEDLLRIM